jgi:hypothetical protein
MTEIDKELLAVQNEEDLRFELRLWINKIKFNKAQLDTFQRYLEKMVKHFGDIEMMSEVERYQNKFIVYRDVSDKLVKELKSLRNKISEFSQGKINGQELKYDIKEEKERLIHRSQSYINIIEELKDNFIYFYTLNYISENHIPAGKN